MPRRRPQDRPLRLAVVLDAALPWNNGGKEQRHHELCTRLAASGVEVTVHTMKWWDGPRVHRADGLRYVAICPRLDLYVGERRSITQAVVFALCCLRLLVARFDVVEADAIPFLPLPVVRVVCWLRRKPMVTTWHEYWGPAYWRAYLGPVKGTVASLVELAAVRLPDVVIAASDGTAERLTGRARSARDVVVVANGVADHGVAARADRAGDPDTSLAMVSAGRLLSHKRVDVAVDAVGVLRARGVPATLQVYGQGPERAALERRAADPALEGAVTVQDFLPEHVDVLRAFAAADVVAFPSEREGFGMVALEAMSVGTPVVTSDHEDNEASRLIVTGAGRTVGANGAVCASDPERFADAAYEVVRHREALSRAAQDTAAAYSWDHLAVAASETYHRAARRHARTPS